jgi:hypothetical protein
VKMSGHRKLSAPLHPNTWAICASICLNMIA